MLPEIVGEDFIPHWTAEMSNEDYHADKSAVSSTALRQILKSPRSYRFADPGESGSFNFGRAFHLALLEHDLFCRLYVRREKFAGKGAVNARKAWFESMPPDAVVLSDDEYADLEGMLNSVTNHPDAFNILKNGVPEISGYFRHPATGIKCRIRPDFWHEGLLALLDVKTTPSVDRHEFSRTIWKFRYDFQMAMYAAGVEQITGKSVEYPLYLAVEKKAPYDCAVFLADETVMNTGIYDFNKAMRLLKGCLETQTWPGYQAKMQPISLPKWALPEDYQ